MALVITEFDGVEVNGDTAYKVVQPESSGSAEYRIRLALRSRVGQFPTIESYEKESIIYQFIIYQNPDDVTDREVFNEQATALFALKHNVIVVATTATDTVRFRATATSFVRRGGGGGKIYDLVLEIPEGTIESDTESASTNQTATVTGSLPVLPTFRIVNTRATGSLKYTRITLADATDANQGLSGFLTMSTFNSTGAGATTAANYRVYYNGMSVPFYIISPNNASSKLFVRVNIPAGGEAYLDVVYGSAITNNLTSQALDTAGMQLTNSGQDADTWHYDSMEASKFPVVTGAMKLERTGTKTFDGVSFGLVSESATQIIFGLKPSEELQNDADSIVFTFGAPLDAAVSGQLKEFQRVVRNVSAADTFKAFIRARKNGRSLWTDIWTATDTTVTSGAATPNAQIAVPGITTTTQTTFDVGDASGLAEYRMIISGSEHMLITDITGNTLTVVRAINNTTATTHLSGVSLLLIGKLADVDFPDDVVAIAIGIEPLADTADAILALSPQATDGTFNVSVEQSPTITVATAVDAYVLDGTLENVVSGDQIIFESVYVCGTGDMIVDCANQEIRTLDDIPWFGSVTFTNPANWLEFKPGNNQWTNLDNTTITASFREKVLA